MEALYTLFIIFLYLFRNFHWLTKTNINEAHYQQIQAIVLSGMGTSDGIVSAAWKYVHDFFSE